MICKKEIGNIRPYKGGDKEKKVLDFFLLISYTIQVGA